jgi:hypothetical protein
LFQGPALPPEEERAMAATTAPTTTTPAPVQNHQRVYIG